MVKPTLSKSKSSGKGAPIKVRTWLQLSRRRRTGSKSPPKNKNKNHDSSVLKEQSVSTQNHATNQRQQRSSGTGPGVQSMGATTASREEKAAKTPQTTLKAASSSTAASSSDEATVDMTPAKPPQSQLDMGLQSSQVSSLTTGSHSPSKKKTKKSAGATSDNDDSSVQTDESKVEKVWLCGACTLENHLRNRRCLVCGARKPLGATIVNRKVNEDETSNDDLTPSHRRKRGRSPNPQSMKSKGTLSVDSSTRKRAKKANESNKPQEALDSPKPKSTTSKKAKGTSSVASSTRKRPKKTTESINQHESLDDTNQKSKGVSPTASSARTRSKSGTEPNQQLTNLDPPSELQKEPCSQSSSSTQGSELQPLQKKKLSASEEKTKSTSSAVPNAGHPHDVAIKDRPSAPSSLPKPQEEKEPPTSESFEPNEKDKASALSLLPKPQEEKPFSPSLIPKAQEANQSPTIDSLTNELTQKDNNTQAPAAVVQTGRAVEIDATPRVFTMKPSGDDGPGLLQKNSESFDLNDDGDYDHVEIRVASCDSCRLIQQRFEMVASELKIWQTQYKQLRDAYSSIYAAFLKQQTSAIDALREKSEAILNQQLPDPSTLLGVLGNVPTVTPTPSTIQPRESSEIAEKLSSNIVANTSPLLAHGSANDALNGSGNLMVNRNAAKEDRIGGVVCFDNPAREKETAAHDIIADRGHSTGADDIRPSGVKMSKEPRSPPDENAKTGSDTETITSTQGTGCVDPISQALLAPSPDWATKEKGPGSLPPLDIAQKHASPAKIANPIGESEEDVLSQSVSGEAAPLTSDRSAGAGSLQFAKSTDGTNASRQQNDENSGRKSTSGWVSNDKACSFLQDMVDKDKSRPTSEWVTAKSNQRAASASGRKSSGQAADLWDDLGDEDQPGYKYQEVVRCKAKRQGLPCHDCPDCRAFYEVLRRTGDNLANSQGTVQFSRHRAQFTPPQTPDDFWEMDFIDEKRKREEQGTKRTTL